MSAAKPDRRALSGAARIYAVQALFQMEAAGQSADRVTREFQNFRIDFDDRDGPTDQAAEALNRARGQIRKIVGDQLSVRFTPTISFERDTVPESSAHMEELLNRARARDEELAKLRANSAWRRTDSISSQL